MQPHASLWRVAGNLRNMSRILFVCLLNLCLAIGSSYAQQANIWYFGRNAGLDFNSGSPVALTNGQTWQEEGCSSIADQNGALLFYTDGLAVWDNNHDTMPNGAGLLGHFSSSQSALIVPRPGSTSLFYIFTITAVAGPDGMNYSEVDMNLNGGLGDVTANKNIPLVTPVLEKVTAVTHNNGTDIWVVTHEENSDAFYAYLVTASGVNPTPVVSNAGPIVTGTLPNNMETYGCMKASLDGSHLVTANHRHPSVVLFDFDNSTGSVSNAQVLDTTYWSYGVEFSPSGDLLYVNAAIARVVYQYDLTAPNVALSETAVGSATTSALFGTLQLGPDDRIYMARQGTFSLSVITDPDVLGIGCNFLADTISLGGAESTFGLPAFAPSLLSPTSTSSPDIAQPEAAFHIYPNPTTGVVMLDGLGNMDKVHVLDITGRQVAHYELTAPNSELNLNHLPKGVYFVQVDEHMEKVVLDR